MPELTGLVCLLGDADADQGVEDPGVLAVILDEDLIRPDQYIGQSGSLAVPVTMDGPS